ncbi:hypothetical protein GCM10023189_10970 [Nibrella saemangeumensis]|uniref:Uncharacterized protein n=1 Tax=Nibrella saemangeumensis TaxID=1084526 RepID=A0ABP8MKE1_9BACT
MTPIDLYNRTPEREDNDLSVLIGCLYNHIPEVSALLELDKSIIDGNNKVVIKYYKDHSFENRYIWRLASVWFEAIPVMIIQNAGLKGEEFQRRLITYEQGYVELIQYLKGLLTDACIDASDLVDQNEEISGLDAFHGCILDSSFEPSPHLILSGVWPYPLAEN